MISVAFFDINAFEKMQDIWIEMAKGKDMTAFQSFSWYKLINEQQLKKANLIPGKSVYAVAYEDGCAKMIAPVHIFRGPAVLSKLNLNPGAYILGKWGYSDYLNFIYSDFSEECFEAIVEQVKLKFKVSDFFIHQICPRTDISNYIESHYPQGKLFDGNCAKITVKANFEDYHSGLSKSVRQNIRTAFNRAEKDNREIRYEIIKQMDEKDAKEFMDIYLERQQIKNTVSQSVISKTIYDLQNIIKKQKNKKFNFLLECLKGNSSVFTIGIYSGKEKIGFCLVANDANAYRVPVVCFKKEYARYSPGIIGIYSFLRDAYENGSIKDFDLLKGTEKYKFDLGAECFSIGYYKV